MSPAERMEGVPESSHTGPAPFGAPLACSLDEESLIARVAEFGQLLDRALVSSEAIDGGVRLRLRASEGVDAELEDLIVREKSCCSFFEFALSRAGAEIELEVRAPESVRPILGALFAAPGGIVGQPGSRPDIASLKTDQKRPLAGRRILVTRPVEQAREFADALRARGAEPVVRPAIQIRPLDDTSELDSALRRVPEYDWVIFTSANGVRHAWDRLEALGLAETLEDGEEGRRPSQPRIAAIGPGTAAALERRGVRPDYVPAEYVAEALADGLPGAEGTAILLLRADIARATLRERLEARGARVDDVTAYRTVPDDSAGAPVSHEAVDAVTFTSSSTVRSWLAAGGSIPEGAAVVCIGPVTARTARELGIHVDAVAGRYAIDGLVEVLERLFAARASAAEAGAQPETEREGVQKQVRSPMPERAGLAEEDQL